MISSSQERFIAECRQTSFLDRRIPLGVSDCVRTEVGPNAIDYFARKHARGEYGTFWFHHVGRGAPWRRNAA
jgi:hypothetical protein